MSDAKETGANSTATPLLTQQTGPKPPAGWNYTSRDLYTLEHKCDDAENAHVKVIVGTVHPCHCMMCGRRWCLNICWCGGCFTTCYILATDSHHNMCPLVSPDANALMFDKATTKVARLTPLGFSGTNLDTLVNQVRRDASNNITFDALVNGAIPALGVAYECVEYE